MKMPFVNKKPIRLIELFGGIGSQAMALTRLGINFEHYRLVEFDKYPVKSYNAIHRTSFEPTDITKIHGTDLGIVDTKDYCYLMTYSFPCQDLSIAGKQKGMSKGDGTRSGLLWEVERLLNETDNLPQLLLMENVPQVHSAKNLPDFKRWIKFLENKGYSNYYQDLNAKNYGVAQNRNRCFMVSILGDFCYYFPPPVKLNKTMKDYLDDTVDEKYYISDEKSQSVIKNVRANPEIRKSDTTKPVLVGGFGEKNFGAQYRQGNRVYDSNSLAMCLTAQSMGCTGGHSYLYLVDGQEDPQIIRDEPLVREGWHRNATEVLNPNGIYRTLSTQLNNLCTKIKERPSLRIRRLTPRECYRFMGFDDESFERAEKVNSNTQLYKQAGNSIVVDVLMAIFDNLLIHGRSAWLDELLKTDEEAV